MIINKHTMNLSSQFKTSRIASITDVNSKIMDTGLQNNEKFWVDKNDNNKKTR